MKNVALLLLLAGCSTTPTTYQRLQWARISTQQAEAECHMEVQRNPMLGMPTCMEAKGWRER